MKQVIFLFVIGISAIVNGQQKFSETVSSEAQNIEVFIENFDDVEIRQAKENLLQVEVTDIMDNGVESSINCNKNICKVVLKAKEPLQIINDKIHQFTLKPPTHTHAVLYVPKNKTVTLFAKTIDITSRDYKGELSFYLDKGKVKLTSIEGNVFVEMFTGNIEASLKNSSLNISTNKGKILWNNSTRQSPLVFSKNSQYVFKVKSISANVVITTD